MASANNVHVAWAEFLARLDEAKASVKARDSGAWFRGHRCGSWDLTPRLLRYSNGLAREETLYTEFVTRGAPFLSDHASEWEVLAKMQHYGVPTRLLDWTERLSTALFFALNGTSESPCIWVLNPFLLAAKASRGRFKAIIDFGDDAEFSYANARNGTWPFRLPFPIVSPWKFTRIGQQGGFFTVNGTDTDPLDTLAPRFVRRVSIPDALIEFARGRLREDGVDEFTAFCDLDSLGRVISKKYKMYP